MNRFDTYPARPFVKWVGGKTQLLEDIKKALPRDLSQRKNVTYVEPFVGGGAVLFWILQEYPNITKAVINDINAKLICTYRVIKSDVENLIIELSRLQGEYLPLEENARKDYFYTRRERFNEGEISDVETAALFIFLNRTCFNGLYRVNSKGKFNVPHGKYANPRICDENTLRADSALLQRVEILCGDFAQTGRYAGDNVLYYFDPPYRPLTETAAFTSYSKDGFDDAEQTRLRDFCDQIASNRSSFVASNSDPQNVDNGDDFFDRLYKMFYVKRVSAARMINSKGDGRGAISEIMISNVADATDMRDCDI
ncbi:DNA adenine methylase [uncultured Alistipes sp.]|jgi:DNA adenine methylase|uniref:DNA adenine methylase n=1 Tax=uncultured Alistipes sp. TaxID=538949 RepID=UPI0025EAACC1|nr:DNA adenine methylase [uncultured Alistipes sp.]